MEKSTDGIKKKLGRYVHLQFELDRIQERIQKMKTAEIFPAAFESGSGGSGQSNPHRQESAIIRRMSYEEKMRIRVATITAEMNAIENGIDALRDPLEREVLRERYIYVDCNRLTAWRQVAVRVYGDDDEKDLLAVYRLHGRALQHLLVIMQEVTQK